MNIIDLHNTAQKSEFLFMHKLKLYCQYKMGNSPIIGEISILCHFSDRFILVEFYDIITCAYLCFIAFTPFLRCLLQNVYNGCINGEEYFYKINIRFVVAKVPSFCVLYVHILKR